MTRPLILLSLCWSLYAAQEITIEHALRAIAEIESGCVVEASGKVTGRWTIGQDGELSMFQIHPSVLRQLGIWNKADKIHKDPVYASSIARLWLGLLLRKYGNYHDSLAAWNGGHGCRGSKAAQDYAARALALTEKLAQEEAAK